MKSKRTTKLFIIFLTLLFSIQFLGCDLFRPTGLNLQEVQDAATAAEVLSFQFDFSRLNVPGLSAPGYEMLWEPDDTSIDEQYRRHTYLTEYKAGTDGYYLVYLNIDLFAEYEEFLVGHQEQWAGNGNLSYYHFTAYDDLLTVDGKYLYCHQQRATEPEQNARVYKANKLQDVPYEMDGYRLVFCAQAKEVEIKQDLTTGQDVNVVKNTYNRVPVAFESERHAPTVYEFIGDERDRQKDANQWYAFAGTLVERFYIDYPERPALYLPIRGGTHIGDTRALYVYEENGVKKVLMPKLEVCDDVEIDLLAGVPTCGNVHFWYDHEDMYAANRTVFADAFERLYEGEVPYPAKSGYKMGVYDFADVCELIKEGV